MNSAPLPRSQAQVSTTEGWWRSLFNASLDAQIVCRADGRIAHANPKACLLFKLPPEPGQAGIPVHGLLPPAALQMFESMAQAAVTEFPPQAKSLKVVFDDGAKLVMDMDFIAMGGGHILINFRDTTTAHRLESHVQRLITAIDATPDVFLVTNKDFQITYVNPAFQSATGYGIEEVMGRLDGFLRAESEQERVRDYLQAVGDGREWVGELVNVRSNGEAYRVESTISPIFDLAGGFMGYVTSERDITLRQRLQEELREERDFAQSILQSLDSAIYSLDREGRLTHANQGWQNLPPEHAGICLGSRPEIGRKLLDYVPDPARREEFASLFQQVLETGKARSDFFQAADGRHWAVKASPWVTGAQDRGLILSVEDHSIYHEVQNQLFQSQKMEVIGTLAAGVAHDFNNLLQVIMGHVQLLQMQAGRQPGMAPQQLQSLEKIGLAAARARDVTQQLLSFSRAKEERHVVLELNQVIQDAAKLARATLRQNVTLEVRPMDEPLEVRMDCTRANQALINLFANAQDALPQGGRITVTNTLVRPAGELAGRPQVRPGREYARCSVADNGTGIAPEILSKIFQPYFSTKAAGKGAGLGLPIVQRIAREADGFVEVESAPGRGAVFHLYLPLARELKPPPTAPAPPPPPARHGRILVVDDVELLRDFARNFLELAGFTVLTAKHGAAALALLEREAAPVDVILSDYNMPSMNGVDLIQQVCARWPRTKFILASGYLDDQAREHVRRQNARLILKPYSVEDLIKVITEELAPD